MIYSEGKNIYPEHEFSFWEWSAPILQTPEEVMAKVHELGLVGRTVKDIRTIGMGYNWEKDDIRDAIHIALNNMAPVLRTQIPNPDDFLPDGVDISRWAEIDEPLLIAFEDGDILGISFDEGSCVRMELNTIPWNLPPGTNRKNFHANRLFADILGKKIMAVEVTATSDEPCFTGAHGLELNEQISYVNKVTLVFDRNSLFGPVQSLTFSAWWDYCHVELTNHNGCACTIAARDIPHVVEGFIDLNDPSQNN